MVKFEVKKIKRPIIGNKRNTLVLQFSVSRLLSYARYCWIMKLFQLYENRFVCRDVDICASTMLKPLCTPRNRKSLCATKYHLETIRNHANRAVKLFPFQQQSSKYHNGSRSISPSRPNFETPSGFLTFFTWQASLQTLKDPTGARRFPTVQHAAQSCS